MKKPYNYIVIEGNIGAGKTTLAKMLAQKYNANLILEEFLSNPFLPKFYENPDKFGFHVELAFLADRYKQVHSEIHSPEIFKSFTVADYYFMKSLIFATITLRKDELSLFKKLFEIIYQTLPKPDLFVYLHCELPELKENIRKRGRSFEQSIPNSYLKDLEKGYFAFMKTQQDFRFAVIDITGIDFTENIGHFERLNKIIMESTHPLGISSHKI